MRDPQSTDPTGWLPLGVVATSVRIALPPLLVFFAILSWPAHADALDVCRQTIRGGEPEDHAVVEVCPRTYLLVTEAAPILLEVRAKGPAHVVVVEVRTIDGPTLRGAPPFCGFVGLYGFQFDGLELKRGIYTFESAPTSGKVSARWIQTAGPPIDPDPFAAPCEPGR